VTEYALGRRVEHDPRSRMFAFVPPRAVAAKTVRWRRYGPVLDQGSVGACTGFAMAQWLNCKPAHNPRGGYVDNDDALMLYALATRHDPWPGTFTYPPPGGQDTGSSGLAACKAAKEFGLISAYRWIFNGVDALKEALRFSPVMAGTVWLSRMFAARPIAGQAPFLQVSGSEEGGHEYLIVGWNERSGYFTMCNSWSGSWGLNGNARIWADDMAELLRRQGDLVVPVI
jgi:hypothetical protein